MHRALRAGVFAVMVLDASTAAAVAPLPTVVYMDGERFEISGEGNSVTGVRRAPVPYDSASVVAAAVVQAQPVPAAVRLVRSAPPQVIDYVFCVTEEGVLVIGQQVRTLDVSSGRYVFTEGDIKRAYQALEATVPWTWIVDIPLGREVAVTLELRAMTALWPIRAVFVTPRLAK
jgi:hypothetical protein